MFETNYEISCVLKSGGDFNWSHVQRLFSQLKEHLTLNFRFTVLSDLMMPEDLVGQGCKLILLKRNWPGWWSKIELFKEFQRTFYFDLDTAIVANINHIIAFPHKFSALHGFYGRPFGSGLMAWNGDYSLIYNEFQFGNPQTTMDYFGLHRKGDQEFIADRIKDPVILQEAFPGQILSYKLHVRDRELPEKARIVCFHGKPRIQDVEEEWLKL